MRGTNTVTVARTARARSPASVPHVVVKPRKHRRPTRNAAGLHVRCELCPRRDLLRGARLDCTCNHAVGVDGTVRRKGAVIKRALATFTAPRAIARAKATRTTGPVPRAREVGGRAATPKRLWDCLLGRCERCCHSAKVWPAHHCRGGPAPAHTTTCRNDANTGMHTGVGRGWRLERHCARGVIRG